MAKETTVPKLCSFVQRFPTLIICFCIVHTQFTNIIRLSDILFLLSVDKNESEELFIIAEIMDTLAVSFMLLSLAGSVAVPLMFIVKNKPVKDFCLYFTAALGIFACAISISLFYPNFVDQLSFALLLGVLSTASILLWHKYKGHTAQGVAAQIMAVFSFTAGLLNAFAV